MARESLSVIESRNAPPSVAADVQGEVFLDNGYYRAEVYPQAGTESKIGELPAGIGAQTAWALGNVVTLLEAAGARPEDAYQVTVTLADPDLKSFSEFNDIYKESELVRDRDVLPTRFTFVENQALSGQLVTVSASAAFRERGRSLLTPVTTDDAPPAVASYSQGMIITGEDSHTVITSGQIGLKPEGGGLVEGGFGPQTERVLMSVGAILEAGDAKPGHITKVDAIITDPTNAGAFERAYRQWDWSKDTQQPTPIVRGLLLGAAVEVRAQAKVPRKTIVDLKPRTARLAA